MQKTSPKNIEVGCATARGQDTFACGQNAARQAIKEITLNPISAVLVFASVYQDIRQLLLGVEGVVGKVPILGASTAGEICNGTHEKSAVIVVLASPYLRVRIGIGHAVSNDWRKAVDEAVKTPEINPFFSPRDQSLWHTLTQQGESAFALLFSPGNTQYQDCRGYEILEYLKCLSSSRLPIFGGCAADDWLMEANYIFSGQQVHPDSLLVAVFETSLQFGATLAHDFFPSNKETTATSVSDHELLELDGQPAADVYSRLMDVPRESLEEKHLTLTTGSIFGIRNLYGQYEINVASYFTRRGGIRLAWPVHEGTCLTLMEPDRRQAGSAGKKALRKAMVLSGVKKPAVVIAFSCAVRPRILPGEKGKEEITSLTKIIPGVPVVGFFCFGEQGMDDEGVSRHSNAVISMMLIGQELSFPARVAQENKLLRMSLMARVTELQQAEETLRCSEEKFRALIESSLDVISILDSTGVMLYKSPSVARILGYDPEELLGKNCFDFIHPEDFEKSSEAFQQIGKTPGNAGRIEFRFLHKNGSWRILEAAVKNLLNLPSVVGIVVNSRDITDRRLLQDQLRQAQKMEAIGTLAGGVAHDFNNILQAIIGNAEMAKLDVPPSSPLDKQLAEILASSHRAKELVKQILTFSRRKHIERVYLDITPHVKEAIRLLRSTLPNTIRICQNISAEAGIVLADSTQVYQIVLNLSTNAAHAMEEKGGVLSIDLSHVEFDEVSAKPYKGLLPGPYVKLTVSDTGHGMDAKTLERIFDPYFTTKEVGKGSGLGLAVVHGIIEGYGGAVTVYSEPEKGTTFNIYFPRVEKPKGVNAKDKHPHSLPKGNEHILFVDDDAVILHIGSVMLERLGYSVTGKVSSKEALDILTSHVDMFDLVITDFIMPQMTGLVLAKAIKNVRSDIPIIICSGFTDQLKTEQIREVDISEFLMKPISMQALAIAVRQVLDKKTGAIS